MLKELQQTLQAVLVSSADIPNLSHLQPSYSLSTAQRLAIYRNNMRANLTRALAENYPVCKKLVGEKFFNAMARRYIVQHPSYSRSLDDYGANLANFMQTFAPIEAIPYLPDVAHLEWTCRWLISQPDAGSFDLQSLARVSAEQHVRLQFNLSQNVRLIASDYPILQIWETNQPDDVGPEEIDLAVGGVKLIVCQWDGRLYIQALEDTSWRLLTAIKCQLTLGEILAKFADHADIMALLSDCIQRGWIGSFSIGDYT